MPVWAVRSRHTSPRGAPGVVAPHTYPIKVLYKGFFPNALLLLLWSSHKCFTITSVVNFIGMNPIQKAEVSVPGQDKSVQRASVGSAKLVHLPARRSWVGCSADTSARALPTRRLAPTPPGSFLEPFVEH